MILLGPELGCILKWTTRYRNCS